MILVDKEIRNMINHNQLIIEGFNLANLGSVSYDLVIDKIIAFTDKDTIEHSEYELEQGEYIIVKTREKLKIPYDLLGKIEEKNSIIRMGLIVSGPCYQPGHETYAYLRVLNISKQKIQLVSGFRIAQIMFEQLSVIPEIAYNQRKDASFNNEECYRGFGKYEHNYRKKMIK